MLARHFDPRWGFPVALHRIWLIHFSQGWPSTYVRMDPSLDSQCSRKSNHCIITECVIFRRNKNIKQFRNKRLNLALEMFLNYSWLISFDMPDRTYRPSSKIWWRTDRLNPLAPRRYRSRDERSIAPTRQEIDQSDRRQLSRSIRWGIAWCWKD